MMFNWIPVLLCSDDEDEFDRMARERDEDLKERDAFAQRMLEKDKAKQDKRKGIVSKSDKKGFEEVLRYFSRFHRVILKAWYFSTPR